MTEQDVLYGGNMAVDPESPPVQTQTEKYLLLCIQQSALRSSRRGSGGDHHQPHHYQPAPGARVYPRHHQPAGQIIPIVDICCFLGQDEESSSCIIILQTQDK